MSTDVIVKYSDDGMWGNTSFEDMEAYDIKESYDLYERQVAESVDFTLSGRYPSYELSFEYGINDDIKIISETLEEEISNRELKELVQEIVGEVWHDMRWLVYA